MYIYVKRVFSAQHTYVDPVLLLSIKNSDRLLPMFYCEINDYYE